MDVVALRAEYGKDLLMIGGINKNALALGKSDIDKEIRRIEPIISKGGFIPWPDHSIPPNVSLENMMYFMSQLENVIDSTPVTGIL
jgi:uroporphyrinogen decarboxylase